MQTCESGGALLIMPSTPLKAIAAWFGLALIVSTVPPLLVAYWLLVA